MDVELWEFLFKNIFYIYDVDKTSHHIFEAFTSLLLYSLLWLSIVGEGLQLFLS